MKGKGLVIVFVLLVLLGLGGYFVMSSKNSGNSTGKPEGSGTVSIKTESSQNKGSDTLKALFASGVPQSCTFKSSTDEYKSEGTVYTSQGKMRGDFSATVNGKEMKSHMIVDGDTSYIWTEGETKGFKATVTKEQKEEAEKTAKENADKTKGGVDLDTKVDYDCKAWLPNGSYFSLPDGVEFVSLDEMMKEFTNQAGDQCSACDSLSGDQKTQCLSAFNCE